MPIPSSFERDGFVSPQQIRSTRRLMIGSEGGPDSGKSHFALTAPGPILWLALDRGVDGVLDNPRSPVHFRDDVAIHVVDVPKATQTSQPQYLEYWKSFYNRFKTALDNPDVRTVILDGDSDSWELQRLAEFGRLSKVPSNMYDNVNAARRAMYARAWDSGKIVIATNRIRKTYVTKFDASGKPEINNSGNEVRVWNGEWERQGFSDQNFLWNVQIRNLYDEAQQIWGVRILKAKADLSLVGYELWGDECNFSTLVQTIYPHVTLKEWGL